jgi:hypothetical protein
MSERGCSLLENSKKVVVDSVNQEIFVAGVNMMVYLGRAQNSSLCTSTCGKTIFGGRTGPW